METRHSVHPEQAKNFTTDELREHFLCENLFVDGEINMVYSHEDRVIIGGAVPGNNKLKLDAGDHLRTDFFLQRREICFINVGDGPGKITVDGEAHTINPKEGIYIGRGKEEVTIESDAEGVPRFYFYSTLAHKACETKVITLDDANKQHLGSIEGSNERTIYKFVDGTYVESCQLMMGMTFLEPNNFWNTMPCHVHDRRSEVYFYWNIPDEHRVFHFMGQPQETRHLVMANEQAVISPPWSIHCGIGTGRYAFIWAMAGENYEFTDMDHIKIGDMK